MPRFSLELDVRFLDSGDTAELISEIKYEASDGTIHLVPSGFITDFATSPAWAQAIVPKIGRYTKACILHDYWYKNAINSKQWADREFHLACVALGTPKWKARLMYIGVKFVGKGNYLKR